MKSVIRFAVISFVIFTFTSAFAQYDDLEDVPLHKSERGFSFSLTTSGLGLGGFYRFALPAYTTFGMDMEFFALRDDKEFEYYNIFGVPVKANNRNQLYFMTGNVAIKKRLFANDIEDNFRPHLMFQGGVIYGMNFPEDSESSEDFFDAEGNLVKIDNFQWSYNAVIGFGVDISTRKNVFTTIRPQYRFVYFPSVIADKTDFGHSAFEIKFEIGGQF